MAVARIYLGVLLAAMALGQLLSLGRFTDALADYDAGSASALAAVLIALEATAALGLLAVPTLRRAGALAGIAAAAVWSALAVQALARGLDVDNCGCFGAYLSQPLTGWVVPQDALFLLVALWVARGALAGGGTQRRARELGHPV